MYDDRIIQSIRILPSDKNTFPTEEEFKAFVEKTMIDRGGYYYFPNLMMNCPKDTLVLFQYNGMIRASGMLINSEKQKKIDERGEKYAGYYLFDIKTLHYLDIPIDKDNLKEIIPTFFGFNQSKQKIDIVYLHEILCLLEKHINNKVDINIPVNPTKFENKGNIIKVTCGKCGYVFYKSRRCPECGQLVKYKGEING